MKLPRVRNTSPVRMRPADKEYVEKLAHETELTQTEILHHAVELLKRERQFHEIRETYASLSDSELAEIWSESLILDRAAADGIK